MLASRERRETSVALTSTLHWFETEALAQERNYQGFSRLNTDLVQHEITRPFTRRVTLDIDSSESPVHGAQEQAAYNGHVESVCDHPLFVFNQDGDCLAATLRPGNVHSADGWEQRLLPVIDRSQAREQTVVVRADAAFALPTLYEALERRDVAYAIRLPAPPPRKRGSARVEGHEALAYASGAPQPSAETRRPTVKLDIGMLTHDLKTLPDYARKVEAMGYDCLWSAETQHDPFLPLAPPP